MDRRPVLAASLTATLNPADALTITNHTAFHHTRMDGDGTYTEVNNASAFGPLIHFQFLGIQTITNSTDMNYRVSPMLGFFAGYQFSSRRIRSIEQLNFGDPIPDRVEGEQDNTLHAGRFGVRMRPIKPLTFIADAEIGRADRPIYPTSEKNYHALGGRIQYRTRTLTFGASSAQTTTSTRASLFAHSSRSRTLFSRLLLVRARLDRPRCELQQATSGHFERDRLLLQQLPCAERPVAIYQQHSCRRTSRVRVPQAKRVELFGGYVRTQDRGQR